jgi:hypothetical protein
MASIPFFSKASFKYRSGRYETSLEFVKNFVFYFVGRLVGDKVLTELVRAFRNSMSVRAKSRTSTKEN